MTRLTARGERVAAWLAPLVIVGACVLGDALGYWITGVKG